MTPQELTPYLSSLVKNQLQLSLMLWGPPGIGKSSIVADVANGAKLQLVDLRLSQLAPTDLRGLPVADKGVSRWFPRNFCPPLAKAFCF